MATTRLGLTGTPWAGADTTGGELGEHLLDATVALPMITVAMEAFTREPYRHDLAGVVLLPLLEVQGLVAVADDTHFAEASTTLPLVTIAGDVFQHPDPPTNGVEVSVTLPLPEVSGNVFQSAPAAPGTGSLGPWLRRRRRI
jgi:hypothetical protein